MAQTKPADARPMREEAAALPERAREAASQDLSLRQCPLQPMRLSSRIQSGMHRAEAGGTSIRII